MHFFTSSLCKPLLILFLLATGGATLGAQTRGSAERGLILWPTLSSGPIREIPLEEEETDESKEGWAPRLLAELSTDNVYFYDPGRSLYYRLMIADYELSTLRASLGWEPDGLLGEGAGRLEANLTGRVLWGGFLDPIIEFHHNVTTLPNAGREQRPWGESLVIVAPVVVTPVAGEIEDYPDEEFIDQAILSTKGPNTSAGIAASYSRSFFAPWFRPFLSASGSTLPRVSSTLGAGGAATAELTGGVHLEWRPVTWLRLAGQTDISGIAIAGAGVWRSLLTNSFLWHAAGRFDLIFGEVTLATIFSLRRSPITVPYYRLESPSAALDIAAYLPFPGWQEQQLVLGFVQDFPPSYVAPDFGISLGIITPFR